MSTYYINEAAFELPDFGFKDSSVNILETTSPSGGAFSLLVNRVPLPVGTSLRDTVRDHVAQATRTLRAYAVLFQNDVEVSQTPAIDVGARWRDDGGMFYTRQVHIAVGALKIIVSANAPLEDRDRCDECIEHVVGTLRIRE